jgi:hypothetical protein
MSIWTWWLPSKEAIDKVVETQEDKKISERERLIGQRARMNRFYKRKHMCQHKPIRKLNLQGGYK